MSQTLRRTGSLPILTRPQAVPHAQELRDARAAADLNLSTAAEALGTWPIRISRLERGLDFDRDLADKYQAWLRAQEAA